MNFNKQIDEELWSWDGRGFKRGYIVNEDFVVVSELKIMYEQVWRELEEIIFNGSPDNELGNPNFRGKIKILFSFGRIIAKIYLLIKLRRKIEQETTSDNVTVKL